MDIITSYSSPSGKENCSDYHAPCSSAESVVYEYFFERQIIAAIFIITAILGTIGNSFVVVAVAFSKKLRTTTNVFVVNLAIADMLTSLFIPWQAVAVLGGDDWPIPSARWVCAMTQFVLIVTLGCSIDSLALIAVNRWVGVTKSRLTTRRFFTSRKVALMVIWSWGTPLCCALIPILTDFGELGYNKLYSACSIITSTKYYQHYRLLLTVIGYPIQFILIIVSYVSIFCFVRKISRNMAQADVPTVSAEVCTGGVNRKMRRNLRKRQLDVTKNLVYIVLAFMCCLTPYFILINIATDLAHKLVPWSGAILFCSCCVNPFIYATSHPDFKDAFEHMIRGHSTPPNSSSQRYQLNK